MKYYFLRMLFLVIVFLSYSCTLQDPDLGDNSEGVPDTADDTTVKGVLTYGVYNYAKGKRIWVAIGAGLQWEEKQLLTDNNGYYIARFDPGTKFADLDWPLTIWAEGPDGTMDIVFNNSIIIGTTFTYNINLTE